MSLVVPRSLRAMEEMLTSFLPFAQEKYGYPETPQIRVSKDPENAKNPLGKTAYYEPENQRITVYVDGRHPKDIMRSISHELVHHHQNVRGDLSGTSSVGEQGYAQKDEHLREMEREAYEQGNLCFRDWEDGVKSENPNMYESLKKTLRLRESQFAATAAEEAGKINSQVQGSAYQTDQAYWESHGISTGEELAISVLTSTYSDMYKSIYNRRPRHQFDSVEAVQAATEDLDRQAEAMMAQNKLDAQAEAEYLEKQKELAALMPDEYDAEFETMPKKSGHGRGLREDMITKNRNLNRRLMENFGYKSPISESADSLPEWMYSHIEAEADNEGVSTQGVNYDEIGAQWTAFEDAAHAALQRIVGINGEDAYLSIDPDLYLLFQTVVESGRSFEDGDMDHLKFRVSLQELAQELQGELQQFADHTGGGSLNMAIQNTIHNEDGGAVKAEALGAGDDPEVYYQPQFDQKLADSGKLGSWEVFASKEVAQKAFPYHDIVEYSPQNPSGIGQPTFVDDRFEQASMEEAHEGGEGVHDIFNMPEPEAVEPTGNPKEDALRQIVAQSQAAKVDGVMVDGYTASAIVQVLDAIRPDIKEKYLASPIHIMAKLALSQVKENKIKEERGEYAPPGPETAGPDTELIEKIAELMASDPEFGMLKPFVEKFKRYTKSGGKVESSLEAALPEYVAGKDVWGVVKKAKAELGRAEKPVRRRTDPPIGGESDYRNENKFKEALKRAFKKNPALIKVAKKIGVKRLAEEISKRDFVAQAWEKAGATSRTVSDEESGSVESFNSWLEAEPARQQNWEPAQSYRGGRVLAYNRKDQKYYDVQADMYVEDDEMAAILPESKFETQLRERLLKVFENKPELAKNRLFINALKKGINKKVMEIKDMKMKTKKKTAATQKFGDVIAETLVATLKEMGHNLFDEYPDEDDEYGGGFDGGDESEESINDLMRQLGISDGTPKPKKKGRGRGRRPTIADDEDVFAAAERDSDGEYDAPPEEEEQYQEELGEEAELPEMQGYSRSYGGEHADEGGEEFPVEFWAKQEAVELQYDNDNKVYFDLTAEEANSISLPELPNGVEPWEVVRNKDTGGFTVYTNAFDNGGDPTVMKEKEFNDPAWSNKRNERLNETLMRWSIK